MTATDSRVRMTCPRCRKNFRLSPHSSGKIVRCPACRTDVPLPPDVPAAAPSPADSGEAAPTATDSPETGAADDGGLQEFLGWLEDILIRMILGIFRFLLVHLPRECVRAVARWFPTLVQALKVGLLGVLWLVLAFGGLGWIAGHEWLVDRLGGDPAAQPGWYLQSPGRWNTLLALYSAGAIVGSGWGLYFVRRKRRRRRAEQQARGVNGAGPPPRIPEGKQTAG